MKNVMSDLAEVIYYIFTSWLAGSITVMVLGGTYLVWKDYRYSSHLKKNSKHRLAQNKALEVARFEKELEAYEASVKSDGSDNEFFMQVADLIESDPSYTFTGAQDLGHSYLPSPWMDTAEVDDFFDNPEMAVSHKNEWFYSENMEIEHPPAYKWIPSEYKPNYTQAELDRMFHEEYTKVSESSPENRVVNTPLQIETFNAFKAAQEDEGFHARLEELLNVNGRPDEEDR